MLKDDKLMDNKAEDALPQQKSLPKVVGLVIERGRIIRINKENKRDVDNKPGKNI